MSQRFSKTNWFPLPKLLHGSHTSFVLQYHVCMNIHAFSYDCERETLFRWSSLRRQVEFWSWVALGHGAVPGGLDPESESDSGSSNRLTTKFRHSRMARRRTLVDLHLADVGCCSSPGQFFSYSEASWEACRVQGRKDRSKTLTNLPSKTCLRANWGEVWKCSRSEELASRRVWECVGEVQAEPKSPDLKTAVQRCRRAKKTYDSILYLFVECHYFLRSALFSYYSTPRRVLFYVYHSD